MEFKQFLNINNLTTFESIKNVLENEQYNMKIKESDLYPSLYLVCQTDKSDNSIPWVRECNGIILEKETNKIVCYSFKKCKDIDTVDTDINLDAARLEIAVDGVLIRVYNYNGIWMISTKKCIDAKKARWLTKKSFHEMFEEVFPTESIGRMDVNEVYSFILCHPENNMVVRYETPKIYHIATRNMITGEEYDKDIGIENVPKQMVVNRDLSILNQLATEYQLNYEGYVLVDSTFNRQKIASPFFKRAREVWGNTNNRFLRYCEIRKEGPTLMEEYLKYFTNDKDLFLEYEKRFTDFGKKVYDTYRARHTNRKQINIPPYMKRVIYDLHGDFLKSRQMTTMVKVMHWISNYDSKLILDLICKSENYKEESENTNEDMKEETMMEN